MTVGATTAGIRASGTWQPLRNPVFRALWIAVLFSNIGNWMETVGAQWLLVSQPNNSILVALVQTADTLPVVLLALPAGVLADVFDRRLLLIATQLFMAVVSVTLAALAAIGQLTPGVLLLLTFLGGAGSGVTAPAWQAMIPDLVPRTQIRAASVLGSVSVNVGRVVGPALAGLLIAGIGVAPVFALNAASFVFFAGVLLWAHVSRQDAPSRRERFLPALRAGGGYVRWSPFVRRVLIRAALFLLPATAIWALLPLVATEALHLDAAGYGVLLAALGLGAIGGVLVLGRLHARFSEDGLLALASLAYAASDGRPRACPARRGRLRSADRGRNGVADRPLHGQRDAADLPAGLGTRPRSRVLPDRAVRVAGARGRDLGCRRRAGRPDRHVRRRRPS